jgi:hypothetical protein
MELIADILLTSGAFGAGIYCYVLASRLRRFTKLETGMGGAIAVLSAQVDDMTRALEAAQTSANGSVSNLSLLAERADAAARRLELLLASLHDLPQHGPPQAQATAATQQPVAEEDTGDDKQLRFVRRRSSRDYVEAAE